MLKNSKGAIISDLTFSQVNYSVEDNQQLDKCKFLEELGIWEVSVSYLWICLTFTGLVRKNVGLTCALEEFYSGNQLKLSELLRETFSQVILFSPLLSEGESLSILNLEFHLQ